MRLLGKVIEVAAVLTLFLLVIITIGAVIMRYVFNMPLQWTEEISGLLMVWVVMFGAVVAERDNTHLSIPFLADALTPRWQRVLTLFVSLISIILLVVMAWSAWKLAAGTAFKTTQILKNILVLDRYCRHGWRYRHCLFYRLTPDKENTQQGR